jgi:hypothetical protein
VAGDRCVGARRSGRTLAGLFNPALGAAAAIGVSLLLAGAVVAHLRVDDAGGASPALAMLVLAIVFIVIRIAAW